MPIATIRLQATSAAGGAPDGGGSCGASPRVMPGLSMGEPKDDPGCFPAAGLGEFCPGMGEGKKTANNNKKAKRI